MKAIALLLLLLVLLPACGDDSNDAPEKCEALVSRLCQRAISCTTSNETMAECVAAVHTGIACAQADAVSDGYQACMDELAVSPCSVLVPPNGEPALPATCNGAILFRQ